MLCVFSEHVYSRYKLNSPKRGSLFTSVRVAGYASWLHCDDSIVQPTAEQLVTSPQHNSTPYILFYRRGDTMVGVEKTVK